MCGKMQEPEGKAESCHILTSGYGKAIAKINSHPLRLPARRPYNTQTVNEIRSISHCPTGMWRQVSHVTEWFHTDACMGRTNWSQKVIDNNNKGGALNLREKLGGLQWCMDMIKYII